MPRLTWLLGAFGLCACAGSAIDVGPGSAESGSGDSVSTAGTSGRNNSLSRVLTCTDINPLPTWDSADACAGSNHLPLVGVWHGYVEQQVSPWDDLRLEIRGASVSGGVCGTLTLGNGTVPAPATDPEQNYPDSSPFEISTGGGPGRGPGGSAPTPGFPLTLSRGDTDGTRVRFSVSTAEVMRSWCALQNSYQLPPNAESPCNCLPAWTSTDVGVNECTLNDQAGQPELVVSMNRCMACISHVCACNAGGCDATPEYASTDFDLRFTSDTAEGSDSTHSGLRVHFTRVP